MKKKEVKSFLDSSWNLRYRLENINCDKELKEEILKYIRNNHDRCTGKRMSILNILYRSNLQYIEEHINDENLLEEVKKLNEGWKWEN